MSNSLSANFFQLQELNPFRVAFNDRDFEILEIREGEARFRDGSRRVYDEAADGAGCTMNIRIEVLIEIRDFRFTPQEPFSVTLFRDKATEQHVPRENRIEHVLQGYESDSSAVFVQYDRHVPSVLLEFVQD